MDQKPFRTIVFDDKHEDGISPIESIADDRISPYHLPTIIDSLEDELMVIDSDYRVVEVNYAVLFNHRKKRQEVIGKYCYEISHGLSDICRLPDHECPIDKVWKTGKISQVTHRHTYYVDGNKQVKYIDIVATPIKDSRGDVIVVTELMRDVTETKKLELKIDKAHQNLIALNTIASVVSQSLDLETVLRSALDKTIEITKADAGGILLLEEENQLVRCHICHGFSDEHEENMCYPLGEGIPGRVAQSEKTITVDDTSECTHYLDIQLATQEGFRSITGVPLRSKGKVLGVLVIHSREVCKFSPDDVHLVNSIAPQIAIAIENAKLHQELQRKEEIRGALLQDIFSIQEEERKRIARELHDETSQSLASLNASLEAAAGMLPVDSEKTKTVLKKAQALSINILDEIHQIIYELRPSLLDDLGLVTAVQWLAENNLSSSGVAVSIKAKGSEQRLSSLLETTLFRVIQEAIKNIAKHAHASNTGISMHFKESVISVHIIDDGIGFVVAETISSNDGQRGLGLLGMKERISIVNGTMDILSHPGEGTEIDIEIPIIQEVSYQ
ncbi:GAF domain-containing protein [Chloroflexota bacterium]